MNWGRAKTILILFFLLLNICLGGILIYMNQMEASLSDEVIQTTIQLLEQNNISFTDYQIVPKQKYPNQNITLSTLKLPDEKRTELWLGKGYTELEKNSALHHYVYMNNGKHLTIEKTRIHFTHDKTLVPLPLVTPKEIQSYLETQLKQFGFEQNEYYFKRLWFENGLYQCVIAPYANDVKVIGVELTVAADSENIVYLSGNWFIDSGTELLGDDGMLDITAVMANLIYLDKEPPIVLEEIYCGTYVSKEYLNNKTVTAVPAYVFAARDGREFCFDARSGERIS